MRGVRAQPSELRVRPVKPEGHAAAWGLLVGEQDAIRDWVGKGLTVVKMAVLLERRGVVERHPLQERHQLYDGIYPMADVFVMPSRAEGFGFTNIEAMSFGREAAVGLAAGSKWNWNIGVAVSRSLDRAPEKTITILGAPPSIPPVSIPLSHWR